MNPAEMGTFIVSRGRETMNVPISVLALLALLCCTPLGAAEVPRNDGWVTDLADMLEPQQESALEALMESYKQGSTNEIALLTVPDLGGEPIERFALEVARACGIGEAERHNAALLVVARDERKLRIEVGRGLECMLTDSISGRIIRDVIAPELARGSFYDGMRAGIEAMHSAAGGDYAELSRQAERAPGGGRKRSLFPFILLFVVLLLLSRGRGRRGGCLFPWLVLSSLGSGGRRASGWHGGGLGGFSGGRGGGGGFGGFGGGGGFSGGGASGSW